MGKNGETPEHDLGEILGRSIVNSIEANDPQKKLARRLSNIIGGAIAGVLSVAFAIIVLAGAVRLGTWILP